MVFIPVHSVLDDQYNYYYASHDIDFQNPALKIISFNELENLLTVVSAINKVLFMNNCHSGELEGEEVFQNTKKINDGDITFRGSTSLNCSSAYQRIKLHM